MYRQFIRVGIGCGGGRATSYASRGGGPATEP
jgi:hypothetical protein